MSLQLVVGAALGNVTKPAVLAQEGKVADYACPACHYVWSAAWPIRLASTCPNCQSHDAAQVIRGTVRDHVDAQP